MTDHDTDATPSRGAGSGWSIGPVSPPVPSPGPSTSPASLFPTGPPNGLLTIRGFALGAAAAVVAAALWTVLVVVTGYQIGMAAIGVALLVASAVRVGSGSLGTVLVRGGSVGLTVVAMAIAEFLIVRHFVNAELAAEGAGEVVPLLVSPIHLVLVVVDSLRFDPLTLVFWAIAVFAAWRYSAPNEG